MDRALTYGKADIAQRLDSGEGLLNALYTQFIFWHAVPLCHWSGCRCLRITYFYDITRNYSSYLILILSKSGRKFGAYTSLNFEGKKIGVSDFEYYKIDNKAFLFSLTDKKTFHVKKDKFALICTNDNLINFGENDLVISNNFLSQISYSDFPINFEGNEKDFKNFIGNDTFQVKEFELFHISKLED